jgi:hypothetical protein
MATPTNTHAESVNDEPRSQGIFMGWLALVLLIVALGAVAFVMFAASSHGFA